MLNINQTTAQLARMSDQSLQQFAQTHKNDPYSLVLAVSESNRRKHLRSASATAPQQPKVVDAAIAGMAQVPTQQLPENTGIGQLPSGDMEFAGGGIIAFNGEDMSDVPGTYEDQQRLFAEYAADNHPRATHTPRTYFTSPENVRDILRNKYTAPVQTGIVSGLPLGGAPTLGPGPGWVNQTPPTPVANAAPTTSGAGIAAARRNAPAAPTNAGTVTTSDTGSAKPGAFGDLFAKTKQDYDAVFGTKQSADLAALQKLREEQGAAGISEAEQERDTSEKERTARGDLFAKRDARLTERERGLNKSKDQLSGMSIMEAGLAIMQSKGRGLAGIAEGAQVGTKKFSEGIEKLKVAQERLDDARDITDELRRNSSEMDRKERAAARKDVRAAQNQAKTYAIEGAKDALDLNYKEARLLYETTSKAQEGNLDRANQRNIAAGNRAHNMAVAMLPSKELMAFGVRGGATPGTIPTTEQVQKGMALARIETEGDVKYYGLYLKEKEEAAKELKDFNMSYHEWLDRSNFNTRSNTAGTDEDSSKIYIPK